MEKKCKHCAMMIPVEAKICPHCRKTQGLTTGVGCMVILAVLVGIGVVGSLVSKQQPTTVISGPGATAPASIPESVPAPQKQYTSEERLDLAKRCLAAGYKPNKDVTKAQFGNINGAKTHLAAIKKDDKEYEEAQTVLKEVSRREQDVRRASVVLLKQTQIEKRKSMGKEIEQIFVKTGMDVYVTISGKEKDVITMTYVLWSRPSAYKYMNNESFYNILKNSGFKKAIFDDKYYNTYTYTIK